MTSNELAVPQQNSPATGPAEPNAAIASLMQHARAMKTAR